METVTKAVLLFFVSLCPVPSFIAGVEGLPPPETYLEGTCSQMPIQPVVASREVIDSFRYIVGGSKYNLHAISSGLSNYARIREDQLYYDACLTRNTSTTTGNKLAAAFGYGVGWIGPTFRVSTRPGVYFDAVPANDEVRLKHGDGFTVIVTLTDHKSFAFLVHCEDGDDVAGWNVATKEPYLDRETVRLIEGHAKYLGFKEENFVFLRFNSCPRHGESDWKTELE